jgi:hypothetical protein
MRERIRACRGKLWESDRLEDLCGTISVIDLKEIVWKGVDFIDLATDRVNWRSLVNTVEILRVA